MTSRKIWMWTFYLTVESQTKKGQLKNLKRTEADDAMNIIHKIILKTKLSLLWITYFSKYVGDLLDSYFGRDNFFETCCYILSCMYF